MSARTGVVQEAGVPLTPSISTRQRRQEPNGSILSVEQSLGMGRSIMLAARMIDVPSGTVTSAPSISSVTRFSDSRSGVP